MTFSIVLFGRRTSKMKNNFKYLFLGLLTCSLASCAGSNYYDGDYKGGYGGAHEDADYGYKGGSAVPAGSYAAAEMMGSEAPATSGEVGASKGKDYIIPAGQLTASALDDNKYYDFWQEITSRGQESNGPLYPYKTLAKDNFVTQNRIKLTVKNANDIYITLKEDNKTFHVDNFHNAYLFAKNAREEYEVTISYLDTNGERQSVDKTVKNNDEIDLENEFTTANNLEIMFVIDATGSMGDEMNYVKSEITDVISKVKNANPTSKVALAMMVYRDTRDEYTTRYSDFTENIDSQKAFLSRQTAAGGGDYEEAVDVALAEAVDKQWSTVGTKLLFHVADAPAHDKDLAAWSAAADKAAAKGIQIMTIAASGINRKTEFYFRSQSLITGGQYVFLTDDSGIGNSHEKPTVPEKLTVEYLNDCIIRLINGYHKGVMEEPVDYTQVVKQ